MAHPMIARRNDFTGKVSPRIPVPRNKPLTSCKPEIENRIRRLLTWHAGDCGLINSRVLQLIADLHLEGEVSMQDLFKLTKPLVYSAIYWRVDDIREAQRKNAKAARAKEKGIWER